MSKPARVSWNGSKWIPAGVAIGFSFLCGWGVNHLIMAFAYLGLPGGLAYFAISQSGSEDGAAKRALEVLYLLVNSLFYFFVIRFIQKKLLSRLLE